MSLTDRDRDHTGEEELFGGLLLFIWSGGICHLAIFPIQ